MHSSKLAGITFVAALIAAPALVAANTSPQGSRSSSDGQGSMRHGAQPTNSGNANSGSVGGEVDRSTTADDRTGSTAGRDATTGADVDTRYGSTAGARGATGTTAGSDREYDRSTSGMAASGTQPGDAGSRGDLPATASPLPLVGLLGLLSLGSGFALRRRRLS